MSSRIDVERSASRCPYCHDQIVADQDWKACASCLARHHASCWAESGRCGTCGEREVLTRSGPKKSKASGARRAFPVLATAIAGLGLGLPVGMLLRPSPSTGAGDQTPALDPGRDGPAPMTTFAIARPKPVERPKPAAPPPPPPPTVIVDPPPPVREPVQCLTLGVNFDPAHFTVTPDGKYLLLANRDANKVIVWNWDRDEEEKRISVEAGPCFVYARDKRAYVCNGKASTLSEIDLDNMRVVNTINLPTGQPYYISSLPQKGAPLFVTCGEYANKKVVRLDPAKEKGQVVLQEVYMAALTVHSSGRLAVKQGDNGSGHWLYEMGPGVTLGRQLGYQSNSAGILFPDRSGKYWLGYGTVWDAALSKQVAKLDKAEYVLDHPTDSLLVALNLGDPWNRNNQGTVTIYNTTHFTSRFTRSFPLPAPKNEDYYNRAVNLSRPIVITGAGGTAVLFPYRGSMCKLLISPDAYPTGGESARLKKPIPRTISAGPSWSFKLEVLNAKAPPTFKGLELPVGCEVDPSSGEIAWQYPTKGEYDLAIKVFVGPDDYFLLEEHVTVENPR